MDDFRSPRTTQGYSLRKAKKADLDDITQVHIDGFVEEPMDNYCYPYRFEHPKDHFKWMKKEYENYLDNPEKFLVHVTEAPEQAESDGVKHKVVAFAVWNIAVLAKASTLDRGLGERKDAIKEHVEAYVEVASKRYKKGGFFFKWAEKQVNLSVLTVLPDFRRHGVGTMMVNWGIDAATDKGWPVTVCASPLGALLYAHLKFEAIGTEVIEVEDEDDSFSSSVMVYDPPATAASN